MVDTELSDYTQKPDKCNNNGVIGKKSINKLYCRSLSIRLRDLFIDCDYGQINPYKPIIQVFASAFTKL